MTEQEMVQKALEARTNAYVPYSGFHVGACLLDEDGVAHTGCNVENVSYSVTCCAERVALFKAVSLGTHRFTMLAVASDSPETIWPCGVCRQALAEFGLDLVVLGSDRQGNYIRSSLRELLPRAFDEIIKE